MLGAFRSTFLLGSNSPALIANLEPVLLSCGASVSVETASEKAFHVMNGHEPPTLVLLDLDLPDMGIGQLLACMRIEKARRRFPIVLFQTMFPGSGWICLPKA